MLVPTRMRPFTPSYIRIERDAVMFSLAGLSATPGTAPTMNWCGMFGLGGGVSAAAAAAASVAAASSRKSTAQRRVVIVACGMMIVVGLFVKKDTTQQLSNCTIPTLSSNKQQQTFTVAAAKLLRTHLRRTVRPPGEQYQGVWISMI
jgi:apolipoprotein N-acyltransferase